jgi:hypothetical protein
VVGPSPGSGEAEAPPRSRSSLSSEVEDESEPRVGRGGDRRLRPRLSPSPGVGRGGVRRLPEPRLSTSPGVGQGGVRRLSEPRLSPSPGVGRGGVCRLPEPRLSPSPGFGRGGASYSARGRTWLLSASLYRVAQQSERRRRRCLLVGRSVERRSDCGHFGSIDSKACFRIRCQAILALNAPAIWSVGVAIWPRLLLGEDWASGEPKVCPLFEGALGRDVNPSGSAALARGWARARRDRVP